MIDLTVKTLDSQNHAFSVGDDITVTQFKEEIAGRISIPVESQRLIYCGRVLQDNKKLKEYDVKGKVVHLVQRAPPSATRRSRSPSFNRPQSGRRSGPSASANAMYLGSMAFPSSLMEAQGIVPPPPTQSLAGSRLNVARRMILRADVILNHLEDRVNSRRRDSPPDEPQDDITPVLAAEFNVPPDQDPMEHIAYAVSQIDNDILQLASSLSRSSAPATETETAPTNLASTSETEMVTETTASSSENEMLTDTPPDDCVVITHDAAASIVDPGLSEESSDNGGASSENGASAGARAQSVPTELNLPTNESSTASTTPTETNRDEATGDNAGTGRLPENATGTIEMSRLLDDLNKIHERMRPFMDRYHAFMRNDPPHNVFDIQDSLETNQVINRVSELMHLLGHAYHSLSDVMVQVNATPPRPLLCRPILIQHSAVVQAGIPIQVEAQINLAGPDSTTPDSNPSTTQPSTESTPTNPDTTTTTPQSTPTTTGSLPTAHVRPSIHEIRIDSFPFEYRTFPRWYTRPRNPSGTTSATASPPSTETSAPQSEASQGESAPAPPDANQTGGDRPESGQMPPFMNNPNMEFFMEVTPESITIDSLETTVVSSAAQADNVLRGSFGSPPPEFIQSIIQAVAGQIMAGGGHGNIPTHIPVTIHAETATATTNTTSSASETPSDTTPTDPVSDSSTTSQPTTTPRTNLNSQARGNTQTHPTTATQTRSTSRPHVHLAQHTMQGFDPFLPCNSHHIRHRRHRGGLGHGSGQPHGLSVVGGVVTSIPGAGLAPNQAPGAADTGEAHNNNSPNPLYNVLQGLMRTLGGANATRVPSSNAPASGPETPTTEASSPRAGSRATDSAIPLPPDIDIVGLTSMLFERNAANGTTIASFLQHFPEHQYTEGDSLFTDMMMTLARGLTFRDLVAINRGHIDSLIRIRPLLRTFFRNRVLAGECPTQAAIERGSNRLIEELQPLFDVMATVRVRDNIDIVESSRALCRARFPQIISLVMSRMTGSLSSLVDQTLLTIREFCAMAMYSFSDGPAGIEEMITTLVRRYSEGVSPSIYQWTLNTSLTQLRAFLTSLDVTDSSIRPFIVYKTTTATAEQPNRTDTTDAPPLVPEAMECDEEAVEAATTTESTIVPPPIQFENLPDSEQLPNVVIGSEPWHRTLTADWIPIITRDTQRQRRQNPQAPFSDAYLSGMPSKRRKIVGNSKPQGNLPQVIADGVRRAVVEADLTPVAPLEVVAQAASSDPALQTAYRDLLRTSVQSELQDNPDFSPERFPNAANYFNLKKK